MATNRYDSTRIFFNDENLYDEIFDKKGVPGINQYVTPRIRDISLNDRLNIDEIYHTWKVGDRFYKLAYEHYGDSRYWWVIAYYNKKPTEASVSLGDVIIVPFPIEDMLNLYGV